MRGRRPRGFRRDRRCVGASRRAVILRSPGSLSRRAARLRRCDAQSADAAQRTAGFHDGFWWIALAGFPFSQHVWNTIGFAAGRLFRPWALFCALRLFGCAYAMRFTFGSRADDAFGTTKAQNETIAGWLYLSPSLIGFSLFFAGPLVFSLLISFFNWDFLGDKNFVGLKNYGALFTLGYRSMPRAGAPLDGVIPNGQSLLMHIDWFGWHGILTAKDAVFWLSIKNILLFLVFAVPLSVIAAYGTFLMRRFFMTQPRRQGAVDRAVDPRRAGRGQAEPRSCRCRHRHDSPRRRVHRRAPLLRGERRLQFREGIDPCFTNLATDRCNRRPSTTTTSTSTASSSSMARCRLLSSMG